MEASVQTIQQDLLLHLISSRCSCKRGVWINLGRSMEKHSFLLLKIRKKDRSCSSLTFLQLSQQSLIILRVLCMQSSQRKWGKFLEKALPWQLLKFQELAYYSESLKSCCGRGPLYQHWIKNVCFQSGFYVTKC